MWKGERVDGPAFYALLCGDDEFCAQLGRTVLAAGRLETSLKKYIRQNAEDPDLTRATLGRLITIARNRNLLSSMLPALEVLRDQRNYLTHNVHALLSGFIVETILEGTNLVDSDVQLYKERAWQLAENLDGLSEILERESTKPVAAADGPLHGPPLNRSVDSTQRQPLEVSMPKHTKSVKKDEAIRRLQMAGLVEVADELDAWRNIIGNDGGWDGWVRRAHPDAVDVIWP